MLSVDPIQARDFVRNTRSKIGSIRDWLAYLVWHSLPGWFGGQLTFKRFMFGSGLFTFAALITLQPIWSKAITPDGLSISSLTERDWLLCGLVLALLFGRSLFDRFLNNARSLRKVEKETYDLALAQVDLFTKFGRQVTLLNQQWAQPHPRR